MKEQPITQTDAPKATLTSHAMLIPWGIFAQRSGLVAALEQIAIPQRKREHTPQTKLLEFLVAILAGCAYLRDISEGPHPLDQDVSVAAAWNQPGWADHSGVSRTLYACTDETVAAVRQALKQVQQPYIDREVVLALQNQGALVYDGDLTGRPVSNSSSTYPQAAFGWMSDAIQLGYQAAMVSMHSPSYGRLWLSVEQHPGDTVSVLEAEALVQAAEASTGVRPWRRTDLVAQRIARYRTQLEKEETRLARAEEQVAQAQAQWEQAEADREHWAQQVAALADSYQAHQRVARPHSRLTQARRKLGVRERRVQRRAADLAQAQQGRERRKQRRTQVYVNLVSLEQRLERYQAENQANPAPIRAIFRLDGGFGSGANIALLIEMGYEVYTKALNHQVARTLRSRVGPATLWTRVGKNATMVSWHNESISNCPYPLDVALERFHTGSKLRHAVLLHYGDTAVGTDLPGWFTFYNGRQTIEAGIKEGKNVFQMHHLKVRSPAGLHIQEEFAAFAANFVRLAAAWLRETSPAAPPPFDRAQVNVKQMVRVAANTSAWVIWQPRGCLLRFTELSAFAGAELVIREAVPMQLALPLFQSCVFSPISMIPPLIAQSLR